VGVYCRRDAGLRPCLMKTWWVGRRKQHRQVYDGRVYRNSCQGRQSMTLQTLAALYTSPVTSPRVDLGHILSMGGLGWAPDDAEIINTGMTRWNCRPGHPLGCAGRVHRESCQGRQSMNLHTIAVLSLFPRELGGSAVEETPGVGPG